MIPHNYRIRLVGVVGNGYAGDLALDDVTISPGICGGKLNAVNVVLEIEVSQTYMYLQVVWLIIKIFLLFSFAANVVDRVVVAKQGCIS